MHVDYDGLGERLEMYREKCGLSKDEVMKRIGISRSGFYSYEAGSGFPGAATMAKMAQLYGVSLRELLGDPEPGRMFPPGELRFTGDPILRKKEAECKSWAQLNILCRYSQRSPNVSRLAHRCKKAPHIDTLIWVSEHLNIPIEDFFLEEVKK